MMRIGGVVHVVERRRGSKVVRYDVVTFPHAVTAHPDGTTTEATLFEVPGEHVVSFLVRVFDSPHEAREAAGEAAARTAAAFGFDLEKL